MLILLFIMNLKMTVGRSKRRSFLTLTFLVKTVCKNLLIRKGLYADICHIYICISTDSGVKNNSSKGFLEHVLQLFTQLLFRALSFRADILVFMSCTSFHDARNLCYRFHKSLWLLATLAVKL